MVTSLCGLCGTHIPAVSFWWSCWHVPPIMHTMPSSVNFPFFVKPDKISRPEITSPLVHPASPEPTKYANVDLLLGQRRWPRWWSSNTSIYHFYPHEVVSRYRDPQVQVIENYLEFTNLKYQGYGF